MKRQLPLDTMTVGVITILLFISTFAMTYAQSDGGGDVMLPVVIVDEAEPSDSEGLPPADTPIGVSTTEPVQPTSPPPTLPPPTPTPTPTPASSLPDNSAWAPPPSPTPTPTLEPNYPEWVMGTYNMRIDKREGWGVFRSDGTFTERWSTFGTAGTRTYDGTWFVNDGQLFAAYTDHNGDFHTAHFLIEQTEDGFRLMGGDHKLRSVLFEQTEPFDAVGSYAGEPVPVSHWMRGKWSYLSGRTSYQIILDDDGTYKLYQAASYISEDELPDPFEAGQWSIWADQMIILPDGETLGDAHSYLITASTRGYINIEGGRFGRGDAGLLRKRYYPPTSMWAFEGHYQDGDMKLVIEKDEASDEYTANLLEAGIRTIITGTLNGDNNLVLFDTDGDAYDPLWPHFNTLNYDSWEFPEWLSKVAETELPPPENHLGMWIIDYTIFGDTELWLLPDGRYLTKSGSGYQTDGTYTIANGLITYDPLCDEPYSYEIEFVDNQMIQTGGTTVLTYHYAPKMLGDVMAAMANRDQTEGQNNAAFAAAHSLASRDPNYFVVPGGYVVADFNAENVFDNVTVFKEPETYLITYPTTPPNQTAFFLFPNGRYQYFTRVYIDLPGDFGEYQMAMAWGKYKVEDELIYTVNDTGEVIELDLKLGRRRAMWGETCFDHLDWVSDD